MFIHMYVSECVYICRNIMLNFYDYKSSNDSMTHATHNADGRIQ